MRRRRVLVSVAAGVAASIVAAAPAVAFWSASATTSLSASAGSLSTGATPTAGVTGRDVTVSWAADPIGAAATYTVTRYNASTGAAQTTLAGCAGTLSTTTCTEQSVPSGSWRYAVTPTLDSWTGPQGAESATVVVGAPALSTLSPVTADGGTENVTVSSFEDDEGVTFCLDTSTAPCPGSQVGSVTVPASGGSAGATLTFPAGLKVGAHTVYAIGSSSSSEVASQPLTVTFGAAAKLVFTTSPAQAAAGVTFATQPVVEVEDAEGNLVTSSSATVSMAIKPGTGAATAKLSGCASTRASGGIATFSGCSVNLSGGTYELTASASGLSSANSAAFDVVAGLVFSSVEVNGASVTPSCSGTIGSDYACTVTGAKKATTTAYVTFVDSSGTPRVYSNASNTTIGAVTTGKDGATSSVVVDAGASTSATDISVTQNGSSSATITVTFDGVTTTLTIS